MFPTSINVSQLNGNNGFAVNGIDAGDYSGGSVSNAGDINGDGIDDIVIGARRAEPNGKTYAGEAYVVFGGKNVGNNGNFELSVLNGNNGFIINAIDENDFLGESVSNAGDINGDGLDDLIIGAYRADPNGRETAGESYVIFGSKNISSPVELSELNGSNGFVLNGIDGGNSTLLGDLSGGSVSNAGDINGDGFDDLLIGAIGGDGNSNSTLNPGETYVVFGGTNISSSGNFELSELNGNNGFVLNGIDVGDSSGSSVSNAGDVNGDGFDDIIVGAPNADSNSLMFAGESYVVFGGSSVGNTGTVELAELNGQNGFLIRGVGVNEYERTGNSVSNAGDINGDGFDDLIISSPVADVYNYGLLEKTYVVFGGSSVGNTGSLELSNLNGSNGFVINGVDPGDGLGASVSNVGDINNDGIDDIIIGASSAKLNNEDSAGEAYIVFGGINIGASGSLNLSNLNGQNGFLVQAVSGDELLGNSVSNAGDINDDGIDDIIIGARRADPNGRNRAGQSYVIFGKDESQPNKITGTPQNDTINGTLDADKIHALAGNDSVRGLAGNDTLFGDGGNDTLFGNNGNDVINGGDGNDTIWGQADNDLLNGNNGRDRVLGNNGNDTLLGGNGIDTLFGGNGNDSVNGNSGDDRVNGNAGNDTLFGGLGNDIIFAGTGEDQLFGGEGNDVLWGQADNDTLVGGAEDDILYGNNGNDVLVGGDGVDSLFGNNGNDSIAGENGNDILFGNDGNDTLYGGNGNDTLWGGSGSDTFELSRGGNIGVERVKDYQDGVDKFLLSDKFGLGSLAFSDLTITQNGNNTQIKITANNQVLAVVDNTNAGQLNSNDFLVG